MCVNNYRCIDRCTVPMHFGKWWILETIIFQRHSNISFSFMSFFFTNTCKYVFLGNYACLSCWTRTTNLINDKFLLNDLPSLVLVWMRRHIWHSLKKWEKCFARYSKLIRRHPFRSSYEISDTPENQYFVNVFETTASNPFDIDLIPLMTFTHSLFLLSKFNNKIKEEKKTQIHWLILWSKIETAVTLI